MPEPTVNIPYFANGSQNPLENYRNDAHFLWNAAVKSFGMDKLASIQSDINALNSFLDLSYSIYSQTTQPLGIGDNEALYGRYVDTVLTNYYQTLYAIFDSCQIPFISAIEQADHPMLDIAFSADRLMYATTTNNKYKGMISGDILSYAMRLASYLTLSQYDTVIGFTNHGEPRITIAYGKNREASIKRARKFAAMREEGTLQIPDDFTILPYLSQRSRQTDNLWKLLLQNYQQDPHHDFLISKLGFDEAKVDAYDEVLAMMLSALLAPTPSAFFVTEQEESGAMLMRIIVVSDGQIAYMDGQDVEVLLKRVARHQLKPLDARRADAPNMLEELTEVDDLAELMPTVAFKTVSATKMPYIPVYEKFSMRVMVHGKGLFKVPDFDPKSTLATRILKVFNTVMDHYSDDIVLAAASGASCYVRCLEFANALQLTGNVKLVEQIQKFQKKFLNDYETRFYDFCCEYNTEVLSLPKTVNLINRIYHIQLTGEQHFPKLEEDVQQKIDAIVDKLTEDPTRTCYLRVGIKDPFWKEMIEERTDGRSIALFAAFQFQAFDGEYQPKQKKQIRNFLAYRAFVDETEPDFTYICLSDDTTPQRTEEATDSEREERKQQIYAWTWLNGYPQGWDAQSIIQVHSMIQGIPLDLAEQESSIYKVTE